MDCLSTEQDRECLCFGSPLRPPLVLLHGFLQTGQAWSSVAKVLSDSFFVVAPTIQPRDEFSARLSSLTRSLLASCRGVCRRTGHAQLFLVGYSMGGRVALQLAAQQPRLVRALVLESAGLGPENEAERQDMAKRNADIASRLEKEGMEPFISWWESLPLFASQQHLDADARQRVRAQRIACDPASQALLARYAGAHAMPLACETRAMLSRAPFPVLYLSGRNDAKYSALSATLPKSVEQRSIACGHNVHLESPREFAGVLREFLNRTM